jgi:hypothetical protein
VNRGMFGELLHSLRLGRTVHQGGVHLANFLELRTREVHPRSPQPRLSPQPPPGRPRTTGEVVALQRISCFLCTLR